MKLAEALRVRSDYVTKINNLKGRIKVNAKMQEGDECKDDPTSNLEDLIKIDFNLTKLITQINLVNCEVTLEYPSFIEGSEFSTEIFQKDFSYDDFEIDPERIKPVKKTMCEALMERESIRRRIKHYEDAVDASKYVGGYNYSKSEIRIVSLIDEVMLQKKIDRLSGFLRIMDTKIQERNWEIDFEETLGIVIESQRRKERKRFLYFF
ncbi:hypothetical protein CLIB1444_16S01882 [[Candida] jaroonii]|uniref:Uncharacterized protein n=1 Tax=[Candida] jaroonii TaxID=467808 RepID=A0ACA9YEU5_9ASCO|nr:hypothetical protein CLIB1444_16S01882 [[Candida] jaroonii]